MAFKIHSVDDGRVPAWEYFPAGAITPKVGTALYLASGKLAVASGATKPEFISMIECGAALAAGTIIPVIRASGDIIFETKSSAAFTSINVGDKVTVSTNGDMVTATKTNGVAEVVYIDGTASGDMVRVRFPNTDLGGE